MKVRKRSLGIAQTNTDMSILISSGSRETYIGGMGTIMLDVKNISGAEWQSLSPEEKKKELYKKQKATLDIFLERGAISKAQYDKSLGDLTEKMGMR